MNYLDLASFFVLSDEAQFCFQMQHRNFSLVTRGLLLLFISHWCLCQHRLFIKYIFVIELQNFFPSSTPQIILPTDVGK